MADRQAMGQAIVQARKALGKTQKQISEATGIHKSTLSEMENGRFTGSLDLYERYLDAVGLELNVTPKQHRLPSWDEIDEIFGEDE